jgi:CBS domain-containing protein
VGEVMSPSPTTVGPDTDLAAATEILSTGDYKSLPVVEDSRIVGVLSRRDVVRVLARADSRIESDLRTLFDDVRRDWSVAVADGVVTVMGATSEPDRRLAQALVVTVPGVVALRLDEDPT